MSTMFLRTALFHIDLQEQLNDDSSRRTARSTRPLQLSLAAPLGVVEQRLARVSNALLRALSDTPTPGWSPPRHRHHDGHRHRDYNRRRASCMKSPTCGLHTARQIRADSPPGSSSAPCPARSRLLLRHGAVMLLRGALLHLVVDAVLHVLLELGGLVPPAHRAHFCEAVLTHTSSGTKLAALCQDPLLLVAALAPAAAPTSVVAALNALSALCGSLRSPIDSAPSVSFLCRLLCQDAVVAMTSQPPLRCHVVVLSSKWRCDNHPSSSSSLACCRYMSVVFPPRGAALLIMSATGASTG
eukprot:CAMPEP_0177451190 /NCGR_PEP_ID=MMETSP0369-20130122/9631_1 /TAXON_ID=447022 ORGANISM="Scrippsiella hangoei-like, Strain SHHI-4" /NCGR_SAMPLE_ID=MMETSP0369 /ASSEMBLY_ACC=CAM_ASM_000364 /LENGTH=298 /DNA_ID=CAMNT_0018923757 /DNA_START=21 /DNA_END=917 /DNA_ORIENTATION=+